MTSPPRQRTQQDYFSGGPGSTEEHYQDPGPRVYPASSEAHAPYDDGLGAIGRAATSPTGEQQYTGAQGYGSGAGAYGAQGGGQYGVGGGYGNNNLPPLTIPQPSVPAPNVQVPTPQRLVNPQHQSILHSPESEYPTASAAMSPTSQYTYGSEAEAPRPPSYGQATYNAAVTPATSYPPEKGRS